MNGSDSTSFSVSRWDAGRPAEVDNLVLMTFQEADQHESSGAQGRNFADIHTKYVHQRLQVVKTDFYIG